MSRIYSTAGEVLIWLGLDDQQSEIAFEALQSAIRLQVTKTDHRAMERYCMALRHLFANEYWSRTWIVQEIIFARNITIASGQLRVTWDFLETFFTGVLPRWRSSFQSSQDRLGILLLSVERASAHVLVNSRKDYRKQQRGGDRRANSELFDFLQSHRDSKCLDPRDKIYGLLGLFNEIAVAPMSIDYSKTVEGLLMSATSYILEGLDTARVLLVAELLGSLLEVRTAETSFQKWLRPRLTFQIEGNHFGCHLTPNNWHKLPISVSPCVAVCPVPTTRLLDLKGVSAEEITFWMDPFGQRRLAATQYADWILKNQDALCSTIKDAPTSACLALKQLDDYEGPWSIVKGVKYPTAVISCMIRAYSAGAPLSAINYPKAFVDEQGNVGMVCSNARPGDMVCAMIPPSKASMGSSSSRTTRNTSFPQRIMSWPYAWKPLECVLRPSETGYEVVGSAFILQRGASTFEMLEDAQQPRRLEDVSRSEADAQGLFQLYLDPLNALAFSASSAKLARPVDHGRLKSSIEVTITGSSRTIGI